MNFTMLKLAMNYPTSKLHRELYAH